MKQFIQLTLLLLALLLPATATAYNFKSGGIYYNIISSTDKTVEVTYQVYYSVVEYEAVVPSGYVYDIISDEWDPDYCVYCYSDYSGQVVIPSSVYYNGNTYQVTGIGEDAFMNCLNVSSIAIPNSIKYIRYGAFRNCSSQSLTIPSSVTSLGSDLFEQYTGTLTVNCSSLRDEYVYDDDGYTYTDYSYPFRNGGFSSLTLGNNVTAIPAETFQGCSNLVSATLSGNIATIGNSAFSGCSKLSAIDIDNSSLTSIAFDAFFGCSKLKSVNISNLNNWFNCSFGNNYSSPFCNGADLYVSNTKITNLSTPITVNTIPSYSFYGCSSLTGITINNTVTSIGSSAFTGCYGLTRIQVESGNTKYDSRNNCNAIIETASNTLINGCQNSTIPNSITSIGSSAFFGCSGLTDIDIPNSVTSIGSSAFQNCSGLTNIDIPNSVTSIGDCAFYDCSGLTSITIPNSVTSIGSSAFRNCSGLTSITIPNFVTSIGSSTFYNCSGLTSITIPNFVTSIGSTAFYNCSGLTSITIPNTVTSIGYYAFRNCSGLKYLTWNAINCSSNGDMATSNIENVTIGNEVQTLPNSFVYGSKITGVTIPNSVTSIGSSAFRNCSGLKILTWNAINCSSNGDMTKTNIEQVTIGDEVQTLPSNFVSGSKITTLTIPKSVTTIGNSAFSGCNLKALKYKAINCTSIPADAFQQGITLNSLQFGDSVRYIPAGLPAFEMVGANLLIPNSVQSIASGALSGGVCDAVVIGNSLNGLEAGTFSEGIKVAYVSNAEPIPSAPAAFADPQTLYVPGGSKVKYWTAQGWNEFKEIIQGPYIPVDSLAIDSEISMPKGSTRQLTATISPTDATATSIKWFSKDASIATVDNNGVIQAIDHGETDIYAVVDTVMAICHVNVNVALVEALTLNATQLLLEPDAIFTLTATANPDYAENKAVEWEIPENDVIVHFINGNSINIGTLQEGTVTVTAHAVDGSNLTASCVITVQQDIVHATSIELNQTSAGLNEGETLQLTAAVMPEDATDRSVTWATSDAAVATVDQNGLVTAVAAGTATITASTVDGSELTASCTVTVNGVAYNNSLDADAMTVYCGEEKQLAIRMNNESSITAVQCDIYLPESITIATEDGDYLIDLVSSRMGSNHVVSTNDLSNGAIRLFITSATSKPFKGNSGDLFILNLVVADDAESGDCSLDLRNVILSDTEAHPYYAADLNIPISIRDYIKGDVNSDRTVNVADYVATANYILELDPHPFLFAAGDIDENGTINVSDLVGVANIALNFIGAPVHYGSAMGEADGMMSLAANCMSTASGKYEVTIDLNNSNAITAFQMDLALPMGMTLTNAWLSDRASASHSLEVTKLSSGAYRLLGASMMSKTFTGNEGALLTMEIEGTTDGMALIDDIMLAEPNTALHKLDAMALSFEQTGLKDINAGLRIYVENGMVVVESPVATTVQFILPNGMNVTRDVKAGRNVYSTGFSGIVIVKAGDQVKKLKL